MFVYIYKLIKKDAVNDDMIYIGSTINIDKRWIRHKSNCNNFNNDNYNYNLYQYIRENGGIDKWEMVVLDKLEVYYIKCEKRYNYEGRFIKAFDSFNKLNENIAGRTQKKWAEDNVDKRKEYLKEYRKKNNEEKSIYLKKYYEFTKGERKKEINCNVCGCLITKQSLTRHQKTKKCMNKTSQFILDD